MIQESTTSTMPLEDCEEGLTMPKLRSVSVAQSVKSGMQSIGRWFEPSTNIKLRIDMAKEENNMINYGNAEMLLSGIDVSIINYRYSATLDKIKFSVIETKENLQAIKSLCSKTQTLLEFTDTKTKKSKGYFYITKKHSSKNIIRDKLLKKWHDFELQLVE